VRDRDPALLLTDDIAASTDALRQGQLVAIPTETVYGLGADAENEAAVRRVFQAKGRPVDHPLIVHLASAEQIHDGWARDVPSWGQGLAAFAWPGPLTLILPRGSRASHVVTGGQESVGLRVPSHPIAHELLTRFGGGIAAPSANRFGRVSPTTAEHVIEELGDWLQIPGDLVLDGGPSSVGVESTIVDCTGERPRLLRPGAISRHVIESVTGLALGESDGSIRASGTLASHYSPLARVAVVSASEVQAVAESAATPALLALADIPTPPGVVRLAQPRDAHEYARDLYAALRRADEMHADIVIAVPPSTGDIADAVIDRLLRAATD
jgi:L-threonylcarbamoyladenylate synthase